MSNIKHLLILAAFAASTSSCTGLLTPERQAKLDQAAEKYEDTTGITPAQTGGLLFKWFGDFNEAKAANELRHSSQPAPSAKDVRAVQASAASGNDQSRSERHPHPHWQGSKAASTISLGSEPRVNQQPTTQAHLALGRQRPDGHPAATRDEQTLASQSQLPAPALLVRVVLDRQSVSRASDLAQTAGKQMPYTRHRHTPGLPPATIRRVKVIGADDLSAI